MELMDEIDRPSLAIMSCRWSPLEITLLLRSWYAPDLSGYVAEKAVGLDPINPWVTGLERLFNDGLINPKGGTTERGKAMVRHILDTPVPRKVERWVIERDDSNER